MADLDLLAAYAELRNRLLAELPVGTPQTDAVAAHDLVTANIRLVQKEGELDEAASVAGLDRADFDALAPVLRDAHVGVVRAKATVVEDAKRAAERARLEREAEERARLEAEEVARAEAAKLEETPK